MTTLNSTIKTASFIETKKYQADTSSVQYNSSVKNHFKNRIIAPLCALPALGLMLGILRVCFFIGIHSNGTIDSQGIRLSVLAAIGTNIFVVLGLWGLCSESKKIAIHTTQKELYDYDAFREDLSTLTGALIKEDNLPNTNIWDYHIGRSKQLDIVERFNVSEFAKN